MKEQIVAFLNAEEYSLDLDAATIRVEEVEAILIELGFEEGEEQDSDDVRYSQFFHETFEGVTIKKRFASAKYELTKE